MTEYAFRGTAFHSSTVVRNSTTWWYGWGGYVVPDVYTDLHTELTAIRTGVSMNEMSPIPKIAIRGADAEAFVDYLIPRDVSKLIVGSASYTPWCNHEGKVVADGIVFRLADDHFIFSGDNSTTFFRQQARDFEASVENVTDNFGILAVQGPRSREVLEAATGEPWGDLRFGRHRETNIAGASASVARQGFTGELGFELWVERSNGEAIWEAVAVAGARFGIEPAGEYAIDIARVEAGLILISADYSGAGPDEVSSDVPPNPIDLVTPHELGLGHCINPEKRANFVGRNAMLAEHANGPERRIVGLIFDVDGIVKLARSNGSAPDVSPRVRWDHLPLRHHGDVVGRASSVTWSPSTSQLIGFGLLPIALTEAGTKLTVDWADFWGKELGRAEVVVCDLPFIELRRNE